MTVIDMEKPQLGVFICRCGLNIAQSVDTTTLAEYVKTLPDVIHVEELEFSLLLQGALLGNMNEPSRELFRLQD